ncbi:hypothetical protein TIFTF001_016842 [Ficus carica]|uniref:Uncharacterized protein n=1 Tax=Ficus carica TaxID=3494 RepID=A0AA88A8H0_FICCA|nr:hypothetical protein TIFTF001_016842 [Ficus carica]
MKGDKAALNFKAAALKLGKKFAKQPSATAMASEGCSAGSRISNEAVSATAPKSHSCSAHSKMSHFGNLFYT